MRMGVCPECGANFELDVETCLLDGSALVVAPPAPEERELLASGTIVAEYRIETLLGAGAFGRVYLAHHSSDKQRVALKVLASEHCTHPDTVSRFFSEARAIDRIEHPNIIRVMSTGRLPDQRPYYVMEYLQGWTLAEQLARHGAMPITSALPLLRAIASALDAAHAAGIAHRDLKPDNIFLVQTTPTTSTPLQPKLLDFGVAKLLDGSADHRTRTGTQLGTPAYMAPEQWRGKDVDQRADLFALGVLVYEILTTQRPFDGASAAVVMVKTLTASAPALSCFRPELPAAMDAPAQRMLHKDAASRPASAAAAIDAISIAADG